WLRELTLAGAAKRYGSPQERPKEYRQIEAELEIITRLNYPGYFLIVHNIAKFCEDENILCQGRGSAANSAVCYALGITNVDSVEYNLLFARFLSAERGEPPDIDLDIESRRREEVIQYVYNEYGRDYAAQVANVICYRPRMALRDAARVLGYSMGTIDAWSRQLGPHDPLPAGDPDDVIPEQVTALARRLEKLPRHLGIHSGGMVICDRPVAQVCPTEWARMENRSVLQWDKDSCSDANVTKIDLLGLGMLGCLHDTFDLIHEFHGKRLTLHNVPKEDPAIYQMLSAADSIGVFQVESRAQMATLPRLRPEEFYDLVVEVAIIRPGPIQGGAVHPYLRRKNGGEERTPPHDVLEPVLRRTLGVPLFQEQVMQMAIVAADFTPTEADQLRRAISAKRSDEKMRELRERLMTGMARKGILAEIAEDIYAKLHAFSGFGFPESHAISFAWLVYVSSYVKRYYPAAFCAGLLRNQPMGFYSPASLIADARRHDVPVRRIDVNISQAQATLERATDEEYRPRHRFASPIAQPAIRLGMSDVRSVGETAAKAIAEEREQNGTFASLEDFVRRTGLPTAALEALATAGAFAGFGYNRREALWSVGALARTDAGQLPGTTPGITPPPLPEMSPIEQTFADMWAGNSTPDSHPIEHVRAELEADGVVPLQQLESLPDRHLVRIAGIVTHRQRPPTAGGVCFLNLEDETGMANVICPPPVWERQKRTALGHAALIVVGTLEHSDGAINVLAGRIHPLRAATMDRSRNFR
ncbi:MAG TPA: error-prone DNA polymerase, partial [Mycobacteriales bacterium]|nr:error-prone DNA polymerase [Mycobacteriales bacterium]